MLQIFYKEKPIIISANKTDLKNSLMIDLELLDNIDLIKLLNKKNIRSIGILSKNETSVVSAFKNKFPEITAAGGKVINHNSEILFIYRNKKWDLPKGKSEKNENISQTALREVIEETGIKNLSIVKLPQLVQHIPHSAY